MLEFDVRTGVPTHDDPSGVVRALKATSRWFWRCSREPVEGMIPISQSAPAWQLQRIARWHEEKARRSGEMRHSDMARRLRNAAKVGLANRASLGGFAGSLPATHGHLANGSC